VGGSASALRVDWQIALIKVENVLRDWISLIDINPYRMAKRRENSKLGMQQVTF